MKPKTDRLWHLALLICLATASASCRSADVYTDEGDRALNRNRPHSAISHYNHALALEPHNRRALVMRCIARRQKGDFDGAIDDCTRAIGIDPDSGTAYYARGMAREKKGDYDHALIDYGEALRIDPNDAGTYDARGIARDHKGDLAWAIEDFNNALRINPLDPGTYRDRGLAHEKNHQLELALEDYRKALSLAPAKWPDLSATQRAFDVVQSQVIESSRAAQRTAPVSARLPSAAIKKSPEALPTPAETPEEALSAEQHFARALSRQKSGDLDGAIADYTAALRLRPDWSDAYNNRGAAQTAKGNFDAAISDTSQALRIDDENENAYVNRGIARERKGNYAGAVADYSDALDVAPDDWKREDEIEKALKQVRARLNASLQTNRATAPRTP